MKTFSKRYSIKIPKNIEAFYCGKRQIMLINGPFGRKILKLQVKIEMFEKDNSINVLGSPFKKLSNKDKKTTKSLRGTTVALIKQAFLEVSTTICKKLNLNVVGFMCIPPSDIDPSGYFEEMDKINKINNFKDLSMGMSSDYIKAAQHNSTYLRIGSNIFGKRS